LLGYIIGGPPNMFGSRAELAPRSTRLLVSRCGPLCRSSTAILRLAISRDGLPLKRLVQFWPVEADGAARMLAELI
jgi:hypothetical protein